MVEKLACRKCGRALTRPPTGRPPRWCSTGCRRAAELEVRRLDRHLERLEVRREQLREASGLPGLRDLYGRTTAEQMAAVEAAIGMAEARLRVLLDDGGDHA